MKRMSSLLRARGGGDSHATPGTVYEELDKEFGFTLDPCPLDPEGGLPLFGENGLEKSWAGQRVFCNPPYSNIGPWLAKAREAEVAVFLVPSRTDTSWWHELVMPSANDIRFIRGRLRFGSATNSAPFPSVVLVYHQPTWMDNAERSRQENMS